MSLGSKGWNFSIVNRVHINNAGFVNDRDYEAGETTPLLAVIGDSYVHAPMVSYPDTLHGRLSAAIEGRGRVYSFAASGAPLSQYLVWARHASDIYRPDAMVFVSYPLYGRVPRLVKSQKPVRTKLLVRP